MGETATLATEVYDDDGGICGLRCDRHTRGQARAFFAREFDLWFPDVRLCKIWLRDDPDYRAEMAADGIDEPYDGWPLQRCAESDPGAVAYWHLTVAPDA